MEKNMQKFAKSDAELRAIAVHMGETIVLRSDNVESNADIRRVATAQQERAIYIIAYSALLAISAGIAYDDSGRNQGILDTAEYAINQLLPECNGYETIYKPLSKVIEAWGSANALSQSENVITPGPAEIPAGKTRYWVSVAVDGRYHAEVFADSPEEAKELAGNAVSESDMGELECIDWQQVNCSWIDADGKDHLIDFV